MEDPRVERTKRHKFTDIISITIAAVICGCEDWNEIELFGNRFFAALNPRALQQCLFDSGKLNNTIIT